MWINGAFGAGKTQTAHELHRRVDGSRIADPELLGFALHETLPPAARGDFQDLPQWRTGVVATLRDAEAAHDGPVIVPMTLVRDDYFDEIVGQLRASGVDVRHYACGRGWPTWEAAYSTVTKPQRPSDRPLRVGLVRCAE